MNLNANGPDDGGLVVMKGSSKLMKEFFDVHGRPPVPDGKIDTHAFKEEDKQWFFDRGCEWYKGWSLARAYVTSLQLPTVLTFS